jgi:hypothetical protein
MQALKADVIMRHHQQSLLRIQPLCERAPPHPSFLSTSCVLVSFNIGGSKSWKGSGLLHCGYQR